MTPYEQLLPLVGTLLGTSAWRAVTRDLIDRFAAASGEGPSEPSTTTTVPGLLVMSLISSLAGQVALPVDTPPHTGINYGLDRVRFPAEVPAGARVRAHLTLTSVEEIEHGVQVSRSVEVEIEGGDEPAMVADVVTRYLWAPDTPPPTAHSSSR